LLGGPGRSVADLLAEQTAEQLEPRWRRRRARSSQKRLSSTCPPIQQAEFVQQFNDQVPSRDRSRESRPAPWVATPGATQGSERNDTKLTFSTPSVRLDAPRMTRGSVRQHRTRRSGAVQQPNPGARASLLFGACRSNACPKGRACRIDRGPRIVTQGIPSRPGLAAEARRRLQCIFARDRRLRRVCSRACRVPAHSTNSSASRGSCPMPLPPSH